MRTALLASLFAGLFWNLIVVWLMGGKFSEIISPTWMAAGAIAGIVSGWFAVWSRKRTLGEESLLYGIANYYLGMITYWISFVVIERITICWYHGGWSDFDLYDQLNLIWLFLTLGTAFYGIILIPLCFMTRWLVWKIYTETYK